MSVKRKPRHVLTVVAVLLLLSGAVRIVTGMGPAIALAQDQIAAETSLPEPEPQAEIEPVLAALQAREARVSEREVAVDDRLRAMALAQEELEKRLAELEAAEASLLAALALSETANDDDIARLTAVYEAMKPGDAAGLFEQMEPVFAAGFLVRMRADAAAAIMAGLDPQTAYSVSVIIAGRNANAPTQ